MAVLTQAGPELRKSDHQFYCLVRAGEAHGGRGHPSSIKETHNSEEQGNVATLRETQGPSGLHQGHLWTWHWVWI